MFLGDLPPFGQLRFTCSSFKFWLLWGYLGWHSITQTKMWFIKTEHTNFWFEATLFPLFCFITNNSFSKNNTEWMAAVVIVLLTAKALICSLVSMRKPSHEKSNCSNHCTDLNWLRKKEERARVDSLDIFYLMLDYGSLSRYTQVRSVISMHRLTNLHRQTLSIHIHTLSLV